MSEPISDEQIQHLRRCAENNPWSLQTEHFHELLQAIAERDCHLATAWADLRETQQRLENTEAERERCDIAWKRDQSVIAELRAEVVELNTVLADTSVRATQAQLVAEQSAFAHDKLLLEIAELRKPAAVERNESAEFIRDALRFGDSMSKCTTQIRQLLSAYDKSQQDLARTVNAWQVARVERDAARKSLSEFTCESVDKRAALECRIIAIEAERDAAREAERRLREALERLIKSPGKSASLVGGRLIETRYFDTNDISIAAQALRSTRLSKLQQAINRYVDDPPSCPHGVMAGPCDVCAALAQPQPEPPPSWQVEVRREGLPIITISAPDWLTSEPFTAENGAIIRECIRRLQCYVGDGMTVPRNLTPDCNICGMSPCERGDECLAADWNKGNGNG